MSVRFTGQLARPMNSKQLEDILNVDLETTSKKFMDDVAGLGQHSVKPENIKALLTGMLIMLSKSTTKQQSIKAFKTGFEELVKLKEGNK